MTICCGRSPATVRNVMAELELAGLIDHPHTSAGRQPTDRGYRLYVESIADAVTLARTRKPGLILADIQLADGSSGLDAVNELLRTFEVPVVFITAYPERFLTGERPEPAFLIAKPFQPANVSAVISQALFFQQTARRREAKTA